MISWLTRLGLTALVLMSTGLPPADAADGATVLKELEATTPSWLPSLDTCPADVMPAQETKSGFHEGRCESTLEQCLQNCRGGDAGDCYASAIALQNAKARNPVSQMLFLRACALGVASGCTNRAAGMDSRPGSPCALRTFAAACERDDPWACTMLGLHLVRGIGIDKDHKGAREVLSRSCRFGETDEACRYAKALMEEIRN